MWSGSFWISSRYQCPITVIYKLYNNNFSTKCLFLHFRKGLFPERLPNLKPKLPKRSSVHKSNLVNDWCLPFPGSDRSVMMRTQRARYHTENKRPAQVFCYVQMASLLYTFMTILAGIIFGILAKFGFGRTLLETFPGFFSFGSVSKEVNWMNCTIFKRKHRASRMLLPCIFS